MDTRERLIRDLEEHQFELEVQNRQLRETQTLLEAAARRYADLYDSAPAAYCTLSPAGVVLDVNQSCAKLLCSDRAALEGHPLVEMIVSEDHRAFLDHMLACRTAEEDQSVELHLKPSRGPFMVVQLISSPAHGQQKGFCSVLSDITDRKRAEETMRMALRMRQDFMAIVAHDLRNPLNTILLATDALLRRAPVQERRSVGRFQLETMKDATRRMTRILADLLDISSMDAGHLSIDPGQHDIRELINVSISLVGPSAAEKEQQVVQLGAGTLFAWCDRERTVQMLLNLLTNAVKFTPKGGTITLEAHSNAEGVLVEVRDTGAGIEPQQLPLLFHPYWQADKRLKIGTGLGLSIAKGIVEGHGGRIWAESTRGVGSVFCFTLPTASTQLLQH